MACNCPLCVGRRNDAASEKYVTILQQSPGACAVLNRETMDGMSRSIQRLRTFSEQDFPPILVTRELDLLEKLLANLRETLSP